MTRRATAAPAPDARRPDAAPSAPGAADGARQPASDGVFGGMTRRGGRIAGWFWVFFWLVFLVDPVVRLARGDGGRRVAAGCLVAGALVYVVAMRAAIRAFWRGRATYGPLPLAMTLGAPAAIVALMLVAAHLAGADAYSLLPYAAVILAMGLPARVGLPASGLLCVAAYGLAWVTTGRPMESGLLFSALASAAASGLGAYAITRNIAARRAQEDAAALRLQDERNKMARDLHDILGHSLTVITMKAELAARLVDLDPVKAKAQIEELEQLSRSALADVRRTVSGYREISLAGEIARARATLTDAGIRADLPGSVDDVAPDLRELFAWVVREATTNVIRHSGAKHVRITLRPTEIRYHDDGRGPGDAHPGNGLTGLRERADAAGATLTTSTDGGGFTVVASARAVTGPGRGGPAAGPDPAADGTGAAGAAGSDRAADAVTTRPTKEPR